MKWRQLIFWSLLASAVWVGADGLLKAQTGNTKPSGLAVITDTYGGFPAINLWADDQGYGSGGGIILYDDGTGIIQVYTAPYTPEVFKAAVVMQGATLVASGGAWDANHAALWGSITPDFTTYASLADGAAGLAQCPFGVIPGVNPADINELAFNVTTGPAFGQNYIATVANPGPWSFAELKGFFEHCSSGHENDYIVLGSFPDNTYKALTESNALYPCCDAGGGDPPPTCTGACVWSWYTLGNGQGQWVNVDGECGSGCQCCPPSGTGTPGGSSFNPEEWAYGASVGGAIRDWMRGMAILLMGYSIFMCVIKDINSL